MNHWDDRFLALAEEVATWSKDPSTRVGCVIARPDRTVASLGYNGFPRGVEDHHWRYEVRETKLAMVVHSEPNAIMAAHGPVVGCTIYTVPFPPCSTCAGILIQAGIVRVVAQHPTPAQQERWGSGFATASQMYAEAGVEEVWL